MEEADDPTTINVRVVLSGRSEINITVMFSTEDGRAICELCNLGGDLNKEATALHCASCCMLPSLFFGPLLV